MPGRAQRGTEDATCATVGGSGGSGLSSGGGSAVASPTIGAASHQPEGLLFEVYMGAGSAAAYSGSGIHSTHTPWASPNAK
jgi:hypothetical protein